MNTGGVRRAPRDLLAGAGYLGRGLAGSLTDLATAVTPFAAHLTAFWREAVRVVAMIGIFGGAVLLAVVTFTAVTLIIGEPFYEHIADRVEDWAGGAPAPPRVPLVRRLARAVADGLVVAGVTAAIGVILFVLGFLPLVGQTVVPVLGAIVSGYFLTAELTAIALDRRGLRRRERFAALRTHRWLTIGFGTLTSLVFLIPLGAVVAMPGAVAGATMLGRERLAGVRPGEPSTAEPSGDPSSVEPPDTPPAAP